MLIPQIDIQKTHQAIVEMVSIIPSRKMYEAILRSIDSMMDDIVEARNEISSEDSKVEKALEKWDEVFESFGIREATYYQRIADADDLDEVAFRPMLEGEYSDEKNPPDWPDVETPWRLMNSLALIAAQAGEKKTYFDGLEDRWVENFGRFWSTSAILLGQAALAPKTISLEGPGGPGDGESSLYDQAAARARATMDDVSDFFSGKTLDEAKRSAKHVGIGLGVGLFVGVAVAALVFMRMRR